MNERVKEIIKKNEDMIIIGLIVLGLLAGIALPVIAGPRRQTTFDNHSEMYYPGPLFR